MQILNTLNPYSKIDYGNIQYGVCVDYNHISRYKGLRQVTHNINSGDRFIALETPNAINDVSDFTYYVVPAVETNRLDIISNKLYGSAQYSWIIAYFNNIADGFTVNQGQRLKVPTSLSSLFATGQVLAPIPTNTLNLGQE